MSSNRIPEKLLMLRKHYNYSQNYVAKHLGLDVFDYMAIENGRSMFTFEQLNKLANLYHINLESLFIHEQELKLKPINNIFKTDEYSLTFFEKSKYRFRASNIYRFLKNNSFIGVLMAGIITIILVVVIISFMPKGNKITVSRTPKINDNISASSKSVVYINNEGLVSGRGDNSNGQLNLSKYKDIVKVREGSSFTVLLDRNGYVYSEGLLSKFSSEIAKWDNIIDIEVGNSHIVGLTGSGKVLCVGDNEHGECNVSQWHSVTRIYASNNGTIGFDNNGILVAGYVPFKEQIINLKNKDVKHLDFSNSIFTYVDHQGKVYYYSENIFNVSAWSDVELVAAGEDFVAGLRKDYQALIAIDNYLIEERISKWKVKSIASGPDYLVGFDGNKLYGVGNNKYNQFEKDQNDLKELAPIENVTAVVGENEVKFSYDFIANADYYLFELDLGSGFSVRTKERMVYVATNKFVDGEVYTIRITALTDNPSFKNSKPTIQTWKFKALNNKPNNVVEKEEAFKLEELVGKTLNNFEAYLKGLGVTDEQLNKSESSQSCGGSKEPIVVMVEGISGGEELTKNELKKRTIKYQYCQIKENKQ
ncbi:MAG: helix-turn-helix domain-containing protein [Erysipelotrichaceae bacterium]|nr:helix-turn-helix domain-containing protein [Erysipelotrichaceae bacterium]